MKWNWRKLLSPLFMLATLGIVLVIAFGNKEMANAWEALATMHPLWLLAAFGCWLGFLCFDGMCYYCFLKQEGYPVSVGYGIFVALMGFYYGNITPGASGGQPMQVYYMRKKGIPLGIGTSAISLRFMVTQSVLVLIGIALWISNASFVAQQLQGYRWVAVVGIAINGLVVPFILLVALYRPLVQSIVTFFIRLGAKLHWVKNLEETMAHVNHMLDTYKESTVRIGKHPKQLFLQVLFATLSTLGNMLVVVCVYHAFELTGTPWYLLLTLAFLLFLSVSYTPLPGASGMQEGGFLMALHGIFTRGTLGLALLVWRFFTYYLFIIVGAVVTLLSKIRLGGQKEETQKTQIS